MNGATAAVAYNYGGSTYIQVNGATGTTSDNGALLKWDLSSISTNATVTGASISLNVTDASTNAYSLYNLRRAWMEGSNNGSSVLVPPGRTMVPG